MVRILVQALVKGDQMGLFGAKPAAPKPVGPGTPVNVKAHMRVGPHGVEMVNQHERYVVKVTPKAETEGFDAKRYEREVFRMKRAEMDEHLKGMGEDDPRRKVIEAELERRGAKREGKSPKKSEGSEKPKAAESTPEPEKAAEPAPKEPEPEVKPNTEQVPFDPDAKPNDDSKLAGDAYLKKLDEALAESKPGAWDKLLEMFVPPSRRDEVGKWLDKYATDAGQAHDLLTGRDNFGEDQGLDKIAERMGFKPVAKPEAKPEPAESPKADPKAEEPKAEPKAAEEPKAEPEKAPESEKVESEPAPRSERNDDDEPVDIEKRGTGEIRDIGEVVWGARKHKWVRGEQINPENLEQVEALGEAEAQKAVDKVAVFGKYDHAADKANGDTAGASFMKSQIIAAVGSGPAADRESRAWYVEGARWLMGEMQQLHTVDEVLEFLSDWKLMDKGLMVQDQEFTPKELVEHLGPHLGQMVENERGEREFMGTSGHGKGYSGTHYVYDSEDRVPHEIPNFNGKGESKSTTRARVYTLPGDVLTAAGYGREIVRRERDGKTLLVLTKPIKADEGHQTIAKSGAASVVVAKSNPYRRYLIALTGIAANIDLGSANDQARRAHASGGGSSILDYRRVPDASRRLDAEVAKLNKSLQSHRLTRAVNGVGALHDKRREAKQMEASDDWNALLGEKSKEQKGPRLKWARADKPIERKGGAELPKSIDGDALRKRFNFRGVQYGNWVEQDARGEHLTHAYGAFTDLADIMGVEPEVMTHGGKLAIAFGARGGGKAGAHYEAIEQVINLTHTRGAGTLAHEWGHFFDNMMTANPQKIVGRGAGARPQFMSETDEAHAEVHKDVVDAYSKVMSAIYNGKKSDRYHELQGRMRAWNEGFSRQSGMTSQQRQAHTDERRKIMDDIAAHRRESPDDYAKHSRFYEDASMLGDYWTRNHELFARAFESYVEDAIESKGRVNTYLVSGTKEKYEIPRTIETRVGRHSTSETRKCEPYPHGEDRKVINEAMDGLVKAMSRHKSLKKAMARVFIRSRIEVA